MTFEYFPLCRNLLYLTAALTGIMLGCALKLFRRNITTGARNRIVVGIFCVFSGIFVCFSLTLIHSRGTLDFIPPLLPFLGGTVLLFVLAVCFPRGAAFPLVLFGGLVVVWVGYSFLRFPRIRSEGVPLVSVSRTGEGAFALRLTASGEDECRGWTYAFNAEEAESFPELRGLLVSFDAAYPLIGGDRRGMITEIRRNGMAPFFPEGWLLPRWYAALSSGSLPLGVSVQRIRKELRPPFPPGKTNFTLFFDGTAFSYEPSR
jgi:hypothetical protein